MPHQPTSPFSHPQIYCMPKLGLVPTQLTKKSIKLLSAQLYMPLFCCHHLKTSRSYRPENLWINILLRRSLDNCHLQHHVYEPIPTYGFKNIIPRVIYNVISYNAVSISQKVYSCCQKDSNVPDLTILLCFLRNPLIKFLAKKDFFNAETIS